MTVNNSITSGTIAIEDGIKAKEEFAPARKVKVELTFAVPENQDGAAFMHGVARLVEAKVASMLGRTAPAETVLAVTGSVTGAAAGTPAKAETAAAKKKREAAEAAEAAKNAPQKTKADLAKEAGLPGDTTHKGPAADEGELEDEATITANGKVVEEEDELGDLLGDTAPIPVTDAELGKAAQEKNAKAKAEFGDKWAPAKIRDLIAEFAGAGKRINDIPAAKRHDFMKKLEALK